MNNKGSIIFSVMLVLVLSILAAAIMVRSMNENKAAKRLSRSTEAFWIAEAGVHKSVHQLNNNCTSFVQQGTATPCTSCTSCGGGNKTLAVSVSGSCDYDVVLNSANSSLTSTGSCPNRNAAGKIVRSVQASIGSASPFAFAAFAKNSVSLSNNTFVDSYDSSVGAYSNANSTTNGDVGTNGTAAGAIVINNNATVGGDVSTGVGGTVTVGSNAVVTGTTTHTNNVSLPNVSVPAALTSLASGGTYSFSNNQSRTLTVGDYKFSNIAFNNNTTLNITGGQVRLYLTGASAMTLSNNVNITIANGSSVQLFIDGVLNISNNVSLNVAGHLPKNFQVYSTYSGANGIAVNNNADIFAAIYAPNTDISIGNNGDIYGSLIGKTVSASNNAAVHYDETLRTLVTPAGSTGVTLWQEI